MSFLPSESFPRPSQYATHKIPVYYTCFLFLEVLIKNKKLYEAIAQSTLNF